MGCYFKAGASCRLVVFTILCFAIAPASALVFNVSNTNDTYSYTSLRGAVMAANWFGGKNTIILGGQPPARGRNQPPPRVFHLTISGADEDAARTGDLDITRGDLTIIGATTNVVIDATGLGDRVFQVFKYARLTLRNVSITGGTAPGNIYGSVKDGESGGAILNSGTLILVNCVIVGNSSGGGNLPMGNGGYTGGGDGGGIYNLGTLTMNNCLLLRNSAGADGGSGGGLKNDGACFLTNCVISENQSGPDGGNGGGLFNSGKLVLNTCIISNNQTGQGSSEGQVYFAGKPAGLSAPGGNGAGICNAGQMQMVFCTVAGNACGDGGEGGVSVFFSGVKAGSGGSGAGVYNTGRLTIGTTTISGNTCGNGGTGGSGAFYGVYMGALFPGSGGVGGAGGGIYNAGLLDLTSCTIALNQTGAGGYGGNAIEYSSSSGLAALGGPGGDGGGILNDASSTNVVFCNTLIVQNLVNIGGNGGTNTDDYQTTTLIGNSGATGIGFDLAGDFTSQGFNLISIGDDSTGFTNRLNADQVGTLANPIDPRLGPLQMNGGPTPTHALLPGSPALDQGNSFGIHTDQRGDKRPYNNKLIANASGGDGSDIGAFELETP